MELHTIKARMHAGLLNKAERGDLALQLPIGLARDELGRVQKHPSREVQDRIALVFQTFLERRTASKVLQYFNQQQLLLPGRDAAGDLAWKPPTVSAIISILKNPAYAGAFVYGRTRSLPRGVSSNKPAIKRLPLEAWKIRVNDKYPAYVSWQTFEKIQTMLRDNQAEYNRNKTRGVPRAGQALLHGLLYCDECGHKMMVQYHHNTYYLCNHLRQQYGVPVCQNIPADPVDQAVIQAFFDALSPVELDVYAHATTQVWGTDLLSREQKKARLRCLIEKIALHRLAPDQAQARIVRIGGEATTLQIQVQVKRFAALSRAEEMKQTILKLANEGISDEEIAHQLSEGGHRSPMCQHVLPSTVKTIRLKHGILIKRHQSHPRRIDGFLTVPQLAKELGISVHFIYDRIHNGSIGIAKDEVTGLYLFPHRPTTIKQFRKLIAGRLQDLHF